MLLYYNGKVKKRKRKLSFEKANRLKNRIFKRYIDLIKFTFELLKYMSWKSDMVLQDNIKILVNINDGGIYLD